MVTPLLTAFGAGFLASLSPCVYPMLPVTLGFLSRQGTNQKLSQGKKKVQVIAFFLGQVFTFTALGLIAVQLGEIFGFSSQAPAVSFSLGILLLLMAFISVSKGIQNVFSNFNTKLNLLIPKLIPQSGPSKAPSILTGFFFGATSALIASPCTSPVLGGVLGQISGQGSFILGMIQMVAFASGMSLIFLLLGLGMLNGKILPKSGKWLTLVHRATTGILILGALYYFWLALS